MTEVKVNGERRLEGKTLRVAYETSEYVTYHDVENGLFYKQYKLPFEVVE